MASRPAAGGEGAALWAAPPPRDGVRVSLRELGSERVAIAEPASGRASAQVVCVHGLSDHLGRQLASLRWLAHLGYRAIGFELAGHGGRASAWSLSAPVYDAYLASDAPSEVRARLREQPGFAETGALLSRRQYAALRTTEVADHLDQMERVLALARRIDPSSPVVLLGHSLGGLLCLETAWRWSHRDDAPLGSVLLSPALRPQGRPGNRLEGLAIDALWELRRARFSLIRAAVKGALSLNPPLDTSWGVPWISDEREEVALFGEDPLTPERIPARYVSSIEGQLVATRARGAAVPTPALLIVPERDGITSAPEGVAFARAAQAAVGPDRFQLEQLPGLCAHDLLRSSCRDAVRDRIAAWLLELLSARGGVAGRRETRLSA